MADGLDETADLFRNEIAPGSASPRDESGRFSSTAQRPEPLFEPRPLEGDEKTGDTSDGGEDPRLKAIERRVADGRGEEGDADEFGRLSDEAARTRNADGEGKRDGSAKGDGEGPDQKPGDEESDDGAEDAESARWALTHDGKPVEKIEIDVGGETKQVSLQEVVKGYAEQEAINQRARQFEEHARTFEQQSTAVAQEIGQARQTYQQRLEYIGRVMADLYPKELDWQQEYAADPKTAHQKEQVFKHVRGRMESIAHEMQREQAEAQSQYQVQAQQAAQQEAALRRMGQDRSSGAALASPTTATAQNNAFSAMRKVGMEIYGFTEQEIGTVFDPRMLHVLRDASEYRRLTASKPRPVTPDHGRTMTLRKRQPNSRGFWRPADASTTPSKPRRAPEAQSTPPLPSSRGF